MATKNKTPKEKTDTVTIGTRFDDNQKELLEEAAKAADCTVAKFVRDAALQKAVAVLNASGPSEVRLRQLANTIKLVYASTFSQAPKAYLSSTPYRVEDEPMGVIVQRLGSDVALVNQVAHHIIHGGGKRLRPLTVLVAARACGYEQTNHIPTAAIIECPLGKLAVNTLDP